MTFQARSAAAAPICGRLINGVARQLEEALNMVPPLQSSHFTCGLNASVNNHHLTTDSCGNRNGWLICTSVFLAHLLLLRQSACIPPKTASMHGDQEGKKGGATQERLTVAQTVVALPLQHVCGMGICPIGSAPSNSDSDRGRGRGMHERHQHVCCVSSSNLSLVLDTGILHLQQALTVAWFDQPQMPNKCGAYSKRQDMWCPAPKAGAAFGDWNTASTKFHNGKMYNQDVQSRCTIQAVWKHVTMCGYMSVT
eukprot:362080-Chlamydomonas_euryale.AAC.6